MWSIPLACHCPIDRPGDGLVWLYAHLQCLNLYWTMCSQSSCLHVNIVLSCRSIECLVHRPPGLQVSFNVTVSCTHTLDQVDTLVWQVELVGTTVSLATVWLWFVCSMAVISLLLPRHRVININIDITTTIIINFIIFIIIIFFLLCFLSTQTLTEMSNGAWRKRKTHNRTGVRVPDWAEREREL